MRIDLKSEENVWPFIVVTLLALLAAVPGLFVDPLEVDAAQYAAISEEMILRWDWTHFYNRGLEYLDKPPLTFWAVGTSFLIFGKSAFAFKFPSFLFSILTIFCTGMLARDLYTKKAGWITAMLLASCQAVFVMNYDVKTDMFLTAGIMLAVWQLYRWFKKPALSHMLLASLGLGIGLLAKGPLGAIIPAMVLGPWLVFDKKLTKLFHWHWLPALFVIAMMLMPMSIGLYEQHGTTGLKFYYWTQSFGRITGDSEWENNAGFFFLWQTLAWAFLPWTLLLLLSTISWFRKLRERWESPSRKWLIAFCGVFLPLLALSLSKFKLPHYIFIATPFAAILVVEYLNQLEKSKPIFISHLIIAIILWGAGIFLFGLWVPFNGFWVILVAGLFLIGFVGSLFIKTYPVFRMLIPLGLTAIAISFLMNSQLYPWLIKYQVSSQSGKWIAEHEEDYPRIFTLGHSGYSLRFWPDRIIRHLPDLREAERLLAHGDIALLVSDEVLKMIQGLGYEPEIIQEWETTRVNRLKIELLNPATRSDALQKAYFIRLKQIPNISTPAVLQGTYEP